jgi:hypothetical protein
VVHLEGEAAALLHGIAYSGQDAEINDGTSLTAEVSGSAAGSLRLDIRDRGSWPLSASVVALDRAAVSRVARPMPPPSGVLAIVGSMPTPSRPAVVGDERHVVTHLKLGPPGRVRPAAEIGAVIDSARNARIVVLSDWKPDHGLARIVVQLAASGVVSTLAPGIGPVAGLGSRLAESLAISLPHVLDDDLEWAAAHARQTRAAWLEHDLWIRWPDGASGRTPHAVPVPLPSVTVLLASERPDMLPSAMRQIAAQHGVAPEVIVGVHSAEAGAIAPVAGELKSLGLAGEVVRFDPAVPLGGVLNEMTERAAGALVTKWDDDDRYGRHHLEDLLVAARHSRADLVGKRAEFIHFEAEGDTIVRTTRGAERRARNIAGATMLTSRDLLLSIGGFAPLPNAVDFHLRKRFEALGLSVYRTHGFGFVMVRRREAHTWLMPDEQLRTKVERSWRGIPAIADVLPSAEV